MVLYISQKNPFRIQGGFGGYFATTTVSRTCRGREAIAGAQSPSRNRFEEQGDYAIAVGDRNENKRGS